MFYGWWVVVACSLTMLYTAGIIHFGFTAVFEPIAEEFGLGKGTLRNHEHSKKRNQFLSQENQARGCV